MSQISYCTEFNGGVPEHGSDKTGVLRDKIKGSFCKNRFVLPFRGHT